MDDGDNTQSLTERRQLGSVRGLFPVLHVSDDPNKDKDAAMTTTITRIHESLAISEYAADLVPDAHLWPDDPLDRARARALACEMMTGFAGLRSECPCALFARVPAFAPAAQTRVDIERVREVWTECLEHSGGPYLFGPHFGIVDAMYYPVITRFRTYGIALPTPQLRAYVAAVEATPAVVEFVSCAQTEPAIPMYDEYIRKLGGDPEQELGLVK